MPTLILRFPAKRYHATPWGHHVNEGMIEWPPSPWRLLRALLATGYATLHWPAEGPPGTARSLIEKLAGTDPTYILPKATGTHSRHYMPLARLKNGREDTTLVFDTWARVDGKLAVTWDVKLDREEHDLLARLAERLGYLGRSESWVLAKIAAPDEPLPDGDPCLPDRGQPPTGKKWEQVPLLAPMAAKNYAEWRNNTLAEILATLPQPKPGKKPTKKMKDSWEKAIKPYPADLIACLQMQTSEMQSCGWSRPPGSRRIFYWRKIASLEVGPPLIRRKKNVRPIEAMLLALATQSGNEHALPHMTRTLPQAEMLHRQFVGHLNGRNNPAVTGRDDRRLPLREPHRHSHIMPLDLNNDGHLDHVLIWAPMGLDSEAQAAIRAVRRTFTKGRKEHLLVALAGMGNVHILQRLSGRYGRTLGSLLQPGRIWLSATPFIPPRHLKKHGKHSLDGQIRAELLARNLPEPAEIEILDPREHDLARRQRHFVRVRRFGPPPPLDCGFTVWMRFAQPVPGPLALGYGSHFGLGVFRSDHTQKIP